MEKREKKVYLEVMRILACGLVIFNHLAGYALYTYSDGIKQWIYMFLTMITRINVPLFFMISGVLLLGKEESIGKVLKKRVLRIVLVLFIFEAGLYLLNGLNMLRKGYEYKFSAVDFFLDMLSGSVTFTSSYWYLYAYLGFLFMLPFMQRIAKGMKRSDFLNLVALHFVFSSAIPMVNILLNKWGGVFNQHKRKFLCAAFDNEGIFLYSDRILY